MTGRHQGDTFSLGKGALVEMARTRMKDDLPVPNWSPRRRLAVACQILFRQGHSSVLAGQVSARAENSGTYYTQRLGLGLDEINEGNLLTVDEDLNVIKGEGMPNPANRFHSWVYRARDDVNCIVHTHPLHVSALAMTGARLRVAHMDVAMLYEDVAYLERWPGIPVGNSEGELIAKALGRKRVAILAHHGLIAAASSIEEACVLAIQCEKAAQMQLLASCAGEIAELEPALAREAHDWTLNPAKIAATFYYFARCAGQT